jgi:hypothetical protein
MPARSIQLPAGVAVGPQHRYCCTKQQNPGQETQMWIIIRTAKGKNSFLTKSGDWSQDRNDAERFDQFDYAVYYRDKEIPPRERRGVGVVKFV